MPKLTYGLAVFGLGILSALIYGIALTLVTGHVSPDYFDVPYEGNPLGPAIAAGLGGSWYMGAILGAFLALLSVVTNKPELPLRRIIRTLAKGLGGIFFVSMLTLVCSYVAVLTVGLDTPRLSAELLAVGATHTLTYAAASILGLVLCIWVWRTRASIDPQMPSWIDIS